MRLVLFTLAFFLFITFVSSPGLHAQSLHTFSGWGALFSSVKLNKKLSLHFDAQLRSSDNWEQLQTILIRPGLHYKVNANQIATIGYAYVQQLRSLGGISDWEPEHRIWEQYIINQSFPVSGRASALQHRFRLEQRFLPKLKLADSEINNDGYNFSQRLRYFARAVFPFQVCTKFDKGMFVSLQDEIMVNITGASSVNDQFFDQNRAYVSIGYRLSTKADLEVGYMNQYVAGRRDSYTVNNILQLALYLRL